jgi:hypothetical protein
MTDEPRLGRERLDKWLWAARFFKTRTLAAEAIDGGRVQVNGERAKRARMIGVGGEYAAERRALFHPRANRRPEFSRAELRLAVNVGSILEDDDQRGLAHFVEHMAFNGTRNFEKQELVNYLESIGMRFGPDLNAYTSFDETVYMLTRCRPTRAAIAAHRVPDPRGLGHGVTSTREEIERERGVVIEEWRLGRGARRAHARPAASPSCSTARATPSGCRSGARGPGVVPATRRCGASTATGTGPTSWR